jgi:hypothetical protein
MHGGLQLLDYAGREEHMKKRKSAQPGPKMYTKEDPGDTEPSLNREIQSKIGQQLRAMYDDVVDQGVPGRFVELLSRLDQPPETDKNKKKKNLRE